MAKFRINVSYESDLAAVVTLRGEYEATSPKSATVKGARWANQHRPHKRQFRSWVIVIENISEPEKADAEG